MNQGKWKKKLLFGLGSILLKGCDSANIRIGNFSMTPKTLMNKFYSTVIWVSLERLRCEHLQNCDPGVSNISTGSTEKHLALVLEMHRFLNKTTCKFFPPIPFFYISKVYTELIIHRECFFLQILKFAPTAWEIRAAKIETYRTLFDTLKKLWAAFNMCSEKHFRYSFQTTTKKKF